MEFRTLGMTGLRVSALGLGGSSFGGVFHDIDESEAVRTVHVALDGGINYIDVSPYYGATKAETVLGRALREVDRKRYYLSTKVGQYGEEEFDFSAPRTRQSVAESMGRLGVDYLDVVQCHDVEFARPEQIVEETLPTLHKMKAEGKIGHVGITGLPLRALERVLDLALPGAVETVLSFCRYTLNDTALLGLLPRLKHADIGVINASPTGMGLFTPRGAPEWHPASEAIQRACRRAVEVCRERGIDAAGLAIRFALDQPDIATTLVGTADASLMRANLEHAERPIDPADLEAVLEVLRPIHNHNFTRGLPENRDEVIDAESGG